MFLGFSLGFSPGFSFFGFSLGFFLFIGVSSVFLGFSLSFCFSLRVFLGRCLGASRVKVSSDILSPP